MAGVQRYVIALGSNVPHHRHGRPRGVIAAALRHLADHGIAVISRSRTISTPPVGPSRRRYANAAAIIETALPPDQLLKEIKAVERTFGRTRGAQRWASRVLDLDIVLWDSGFWATPGLVIPHPAFRQRGFVLRPAADIAPRWRDPLTGLTIRHLLARHLRARAVDRHHPLDPPLRAA